MKKILQKIKFIRYSSLRFDISKKKFYEELDKIVDEGDLNIFFGAFEKLSKSKNEYIGRVKYGNFEIRKRRRLFDFNMFKPIAKGEFYEEGEFLLVNFESNSFSGFFVLLWIIPFFILILIAMIAFGEFEGDVSKTKMIITLTVNFFLIILCLYGIGRYNSKGLKRDVESRMQKFKNCVA